MLVLLVTLFTSTSHQFDALILIYWTFKIAKESRNFRFDIKSEMLELEDIHSYESSRLIKSGRPNYFRIDYIQARRSFFINHNYGGCNNDAGWFVVIDGDQHCPWGKLHTSYPSLLYATGNNFAPWYAGQNDGRVAEADYFGIYVKYLQQSKSLGFIDLFEEGRPEWRIVFRGTPHINQPVYYAYFHGKENVDMACKQIDVSQPCCAHYRSTILDDWKNIAEVALVLFKGGKMQKYAIFDGVGTSNVNWFSAEKLKSSSWGDLKGHQQYFNIQGHDAPKRRFFINHNYGGCSMDAGWFVAIDQNSLSFPCGYENVKTYPQFMYADSNHFETWSGGKVLEADVMAIFVKFSTTKSSD